MTENGVVEEEGENTYAEERGKQRLEDAARVALFPRSRYATGTGDEFP